MSRITAQDVHRMAFRKAPLGRRGYDEEGVDTFLDEVESTIAALTREVEELRAARSHTGTATAEPEFDSRLSDKIDRIETRLERIEHMLAKGTSRPADPTFGLSL